MSDSVAHSRLAIARRIIAEHCQLAGLTPGMVAHSMYVSTRTLHRILEESGESFRAVLLHERLDRCQRALRDPAFADQFISTIAYQCGFESLATFNRQFQAAFGVTPNAWRNGKL